MTVRRPLLGASVGSPERVEVKGVLSGTDTPSSADRPAAVSSLLTALSGATANATIKPALQAVSQFGLDVSELPHIRGGLVLALTHRSYLHEHQSELPGATAGLLEAFSSLGHAFVLRSAAVELHKQKNFVKVGPFSDQIARVVTTLPRWSKSLTWLHRSVAVGRSLQRDSLPAGVSGDLCRQVLGLLCLTGNVKIAADLIADLLQQERQATGGEVSDPRTRLLEELGSTKLETRVEREGPDHSPRFRATLSDRTGRHAIGEGSSKKLALRHASADYLSRYYPHVRDDDGRSATRRRVPIEGWRLDAHQKAVHRVQDLFGLPPHDRALVSQALVHSSWAYEHQDIIARTGQQDNQVLGLLGSHVLTYEYTLAAVTAACANPPERFPNLTLPNDHYEQAFLRSGVSSGLLLGTGQASLGMNREIAANAFQAVLAAVYLGKRCPKTLLADWPHDWNLFRELIAPKAPRPNDPTSILERILSSARLSSEYAFKRSGPDHANRYRATLVLESAALRRRNKVAGEESVGGKTAAKHKASLVVLDVLDTLADPDRLAETIYSDRTSDLAVFLLAHLAVTVPSSQAATQRWARDRLFGAHLASSPNLLIEWAGCADGLLGRQKLVEPDVEAMSHFYKLVSSSNASAADTINTRLAAVLDGADELREPNMINEPLLRNLAQICGIYRALGSNDTPTDLSTLIDEWHQLYQDRVHSPSAVPHVALGGREQAALNATTALLATQGIVDVGVHEEGALHILVQTRSSVDIDAVGGFCELWSSISPILTLTPRRQGIEAKLAIVQPDLPSGPIGTAVAQSQRPTPSPYHAAVADLLHDLKNQLTAAGKTVGRHVTGRTAQLERQLTASRHLDLAAAIARRLRVASSLLGAPSAVATELSSFMRRYAAAMLAGPSVAVTLSVPSAGTEVIVGLDEPALTAVLDNLVKNAVEAMPAGGAISLRWMTDETDATITVADNGPGLPARVVAALQTGGRIVSTKPGGNGLGLLAATTLLERAGGRLLAETSGPGTTWQVKIPLTTSDELQVVNEP